MTYTTMIVSPHPDDETLRGAGYINFCAKRGDNLVLLAMTDGDGTGMGPREGLTPQQVAYRRSREQENAWSALTYGKGTVIRAGYSDGTVSYDRALQAIQNALLVHPDAQVYAAAHPLDDPNASPDHVPTWQACRDSGAAVVRYLKDPTQPGGATGSHAPPDVKAAQDAVATYFWTLGPRSSVGSIRNALINSGYVSRYTRN